MTTSNFAHGTNSQVTWTTANKASDTSLLAGFESNSIDFDTLNCVDAVISGKIRTGTGPTASRQIDIYMYVARGSSGYTGGCTGADGARTLTAEQKAQLRFIMSLPTNSTSDQDYDFEFNLLDALGYVPTAGGLWFAHNTGVNTNSTAGNHELYCRPLTAVSA